MAIYDSTSWSGENSERKREMDVTEDGINFVYIIIFLPETRRTETVLAYTTVQASARRMAIVPVPRSI